MQVALTAIAKSFGKETVFRDVSFTLAPGSRTALLGPNGSGKSTLLQTIAGALVPTAGTIEHHLGERLIPVDEVYRHVSIAAPYLGLYEDLSLRQAIGFHARFKPLRSGLVPEDIARIAYLESALDKPVLHFSSGMKQRLKLALAILSDAPLLLLDEPASNLDAEAVEWFRQLLRAHAEGRTIVVASNRQAVEYDLCTDAIEMARWKG
ncbi:MAG: ABC transporter ATP-binding protein [Flavobacteriales bacterium]|nr:ABC transporter ATP-binding protein [Flavobacteriales bacterium]